MFGTLGAGIMSLVGLAVLQNERVEPTVEQLTAAFNALPGLTDHDARTRARNAVGMLAKGLEENEARALMTALARVNIAASIVDEAELAELVTPYRVKEARPDADGLLMKDSLNRPMLIKWAAVTCIAAGLVGQTNIHTQRRTRLVQQGLDGGTVVQDQHTTETRASEPIVEIYLNGPPHRLRIEAKQFRFGYLGDQMARDLHDRFDRLVGDLVAHATSATTNRGVEAIVNDHPRRHYRSMPVFEREIIWLQWLASSTLNRA